MIGLERQRRLLQHLRAHGTGNVADLARSLDVSPSTVRRDLADLQRQGLLTRVHGGAAVADGELEAGLSARTLFRGAEKRLIGEAAAARVFDGSTVLITGGTTTLAMLPHLAEREGLTVITNGLGIAWHLSRYPNISVVVLGGVLRHHELSLLGPLALQTLADFQIDEAFTGAFAVDPSSGLSGADVSEVTTDRSMLSSARALTVLADSSKFQQRGPVRLARVDQIGCLITDAGADEASVRGLQAAGVNVIVCDPTTQRSRQADLVPAHTNRQQTR